MQAIIASGWPIASPIQLLDDIDDVRRPGDDPVSTVLEAAPRSNLQHVLPGHAALPLPCPPGSFTFRDGRELLFLVFLDQHAPVVERRENELCAHTIES